MPKIGNEDAIRDREKGESIFIFIERTHYGNRDDALLEQIYEVINDYYDSL